MIPISPAKFIFMPNIYRAKVIFWDKTWHASHVPQSADTKWLPTISCWSVQFRAKNHFWSGCSLYILPLYFTILYQWQQQRHWWRIGGYSVVLGALQEWETKHAWLIATYMHFGKWKLPIPKIHIAPPFMLTRKVHNANKTLIMDVLMPHVRTKNNSRLLGYSSIFPDLKKSPGTTYHQCFVKWISIYLTWSIDQLG